jgi:hypothetical protein
LEVAEEGARRTQAVAWTVDEQALSLSLAGEHPPPPGSHLTLYFQIWTGQERFLRSLRGEVIQVAGRNLAIRFQLLDRVSAAALEELLFYHRRGREEALLQTAI